MGSEFRRQTHDYRRRIACIGGGGARRRRPRRQRTRCYRTPSAWRAAMKTVTNALPPSFLRLKGTFSCLSFNSKGIAPPSVLDNYKGFPLPPF